MQPRNRGFLKLKKGIIRNLHPELKVLDETDIPFEGWFNLDLKFFYVNFGYNHFERGIMTPFVSSIVQVIKEYERDNI